MTPNELNQAYVIGVAARGVLRAREFQKQAMMKQASNPAQFSDLATYGKSVGIPAGVAAILGALINGARGKSILNGALIGGGIGGLAGLGHQALYDLNPGYQEFVNGFGKSKTPEGTSTETPTETSTKTPEEKLPILPGEPEN